ncbi:M20/M25/M40 family metallo-hydrolase [Robiginitalea marina]|uniref:M20/M25/M40 family metallo-hydrolase n=1 Tax=Robiginitalea marina TaxID=2954105 RepID=A0ABT1AY16_9FLAO|nr:M20/M25/M40 family metallo-hydrolase [Robiginitalea marina]MCO5724881.1 M20/M25/M40 family metallo-hydrolase [Robiginitalea marina]
MRNFLFFFLLFSGTLVKAQEDAIFTAQVRHTIDELVEFVALPNDALVSSDIERNLRWLTAKFSERGFNTSVLPTEGQPLFFAALPLKEGKPTLLFYMHFDGQSVDPSKWDQPDPYKAVLKAPRDGRWETLPFSALNDSIPAHWRLYGRSTSDDKGPIVMFLNTIDLLRKTGKELSYNIKVILDGEEEKSSKPLPKAVQQYRELLEADYLLISDGPVHVSGLPTVVYGCRGITSMTLTTYGPVRPQHSGHYGNYAPNPAFRLATLLASMKDEDGKVVIPGYYDGIALSESDREVLRAVPDDPAAIHAMLQIRQPERVGAFYQEALQYPSLNIRGLGSAWIGPEARTIVPATATAELDLRLVPETDGTRLKNLVRKHIEAQGYRIADSIPTPEMRAAYDKWITVEEGSVTDAFRTPLDNPFGQHLVRTLNGTFETPVVQIRIMGGTVPIAPFINALKIPAFILPLVNPDNNQHSPNENLELGQVAYGLNALKAILTTPMGG